MNSFVFNSVASELKTSIYAQSPDTSLKSLQLDSGDRLLIGGNVSIENSSLTVSGTVTVSGINNPITVSEITNPVTIGNATITTVISGSTFTSDSVLDLEITGTGIIFDDTDISSIKTASMFIYNKGTTTVTLSLQMSPTTADINYINDPTYTDFTVEGETNKIVTISLFANYTRLVYDMGAVTGTISAYYNAQT